MAREAFLQELSSYIRHDERHQAKTNTWSKSLERREWLSRLAGEYDAEEFEDIPLSQQRALSDSMARLASANGKADFASVSRVSAILGPIVRDEWTSALERLFVSVERWSDARDWATRRYPKVLEEEVLGTYETSQLLVHNLQVRVLLSPVARFAVGGTGLVELSALPSFDWQSLVRQPTGWVLEMDRLRPRRVAWTEQTFEKAVNALARGAA